MKLQRGMNVDLFAAFAFGVVFVVVLIVLAILFPHPTPFQYEVFRIVLALAAAGVGGLVPGVLEVRFKTLVRAGGAFGLFVIIYFFSPARLLVESPPSPKTSIPVFQRDVHLGDNSFARVGGLTLPKHDDPTLDNKEDIVYYDKDKETFFTHFGLPTGVQLVSSIYGPRFKSVNLAAWKHVVALKPRDWSKDSYEGQSVQIDFDTVLVWRETGGAFYAPIAAVARTKSMNLYKELVTLNVDPAKAKITKAWVRLTGFHGGKRFGQPDNVEFLIDSNVYPIVFKGNDPRTEEVIEFPVDLKHLRVNPSVAQSFALVVLPYAEEKPISPPNSAIPRVGPAHFRDVEIGTVTLVLE